VPGLVTSSAASGARLRIGIELADLKKIPKVLGVAGGVHKVEAILGALRGGFLNVLVTNEIAGIRLLGLEAS
jgi:DNA-binding transcriptional regulator LsrR (DeoR family)